MNTIFLLYTAGRSTTSCRNSKILEKVDKLTVRRLHGMGRKLNEFLVLYESAQSSSEQGAAYVFLTLWAWLTWNRSLTLSHVEYRLRLNFLSVPQSTMLCSSSI